MTLIVDVNLFIMLSLRCRSLFNAGLWLRGRGTREASAVNLRVMPDLDDLDHNSASQSAACLVPFIKRIFCIVSKIRGEEQSCIRRNKLSV
jgi:hypothetical protein